MVWWVRFGESRWYKVQQSRYLSLRSLRAHDGRRTDSNSVHKGGGREGWTDVHLSYAPKCPVKRLPDQCWRQPFEESTWALLLQNGTKCVKTSVIPDGVIDILYRIQRVSVNGMQQAVTPAREDIDGAGYSLTFPENHSSAR